MARSAEEYLKQLQSLLPKGKAWTRSPDSRLTQLLYGMAEELARNEGRSFDLLVERDTRTTTELVTEHETDFGLPENGEELPASIEQRRSELNAKLVAVGQQDKRYFISIAEALGYTVTITEFKPFWASIGVSGESCGDQTNIFYWQVNIELEEGIVLNISSLIRDITKVKPGHTLVNFAWTGVEFDRAYDRSFDSIPSYDGTIFPGAYSPEFDDSYQNNVSYDGVYLVGAFDHSYNLAFDVSRGGDFEFNAYSTAFNKPQ